MVGAVSHSAVQKPTLTSSQVTHKAACLPPLQSNLAHAGTCEVSGHSGEQSRSSELSVTIYKMGIVRILNTGMFFT